MPTTVTDRDCWFVGTAPMLSFVEALLRFRDQHSPEYHARLERIEAYLRRRVTRTTTEATR